MRFIALAKPLQRISASEEQASSMAQYGDPVPAPATRKKSFAFPLAIG